MVPNFSKKAELFNKLFASQCTPLSNTSTLPPLTFRMDKRLSSLKINEDDILSIIKSLNSNKSHAWNKLSVKMAKMCDKTLVYPLKLIFRASIQEGVFPDCWKKANVVPIHKKESKNLLKTIDQLAFFQFLAKYTKESFLKSFLIISIKINFLQNVSLVFSLVIHVFHSYCLLYTKLIRLLIVIQLQMLVEFFQTFLKLLTRYGMREFYLN